MTISLWHDSCKPDTRPHGTPFLPLTFFLISGLPGCLSGSAIHPYCILYEEATPKQVYPFSQRRHFEPVGRHHGHTRVMYSGSYHNMAINARRDLTCISPFRNFILSVTADINHTGHGIMQLPFFCNAHLSVFSRIEIQLLYYFKRS